MNKSESSCSGPIGARVQELLSGNPPWKAKSIWIAVGLALLGALLWVKDSRRAYTPAPESASTEFAASEPGTRAPQQERSPARVPAPVIFRLGISYAGGFFVGWALRRFLKLTLAMALAAILLLVLLRKMGWMDFDWSSADQHVRHTLVWAHSEAGEIKHLLTAFLPSSTAAGLGVFLGFRRK